MTVALVRSPSRRRSSRSSRRGLLLRIRSPFPYQFQTSFWLLAILAAIALERLIRGRRTAAAATVLCTVFVAATALIAVRSVRWGILAQTLDHQDHVLRTVERMTPSGSVVLEGCGFAIHRVPALETWFLPSLARDLMAAGVLPRPTPEQLVSRRVALVVADSRLLAAFADDPAIGPFLVRSFFPLERFVWLPAPNAVLPPGGRMEWTLLHGGAHRIVGGASLASHPWFASPFSFPFQRPRTDAAFRLDAATFGPPDLDTLRLELDGGPLRPSRRGVVELRAGSRLVAVNQGSSPVALLFLPAIARVVLDAPYPSTFLEPGLEF